ncbi:NACHT domain-containing protein [Streptomyces sp. NPDC057238]|uniref:NACHT domain-containing protein n=1 Tax=Streptomyces sp. NPDC057238 TaxID=3346060 RepID=UPI0036343CFA
MKHKEELTKRTVDAHWLLKETKNELAKWATRSERPDQLLILTNVVLTPASGGGEELLNSYLSSVAQNLQLKGWDIWHAEKICRLLDTHTPVRQKYLGHVMGDLLVTLNETLTEDQMELADTLASHLVKTFKAEKYAQLDQGGGVDDRKVPLARVFVDVPYREAEQEQDFLFDEEEPDGIGAASTAHLVTLSDQSATPIDREGDFSRGRFIVIGGPGQGKSTLGRFLSQIYRAELLSRHPHLSRQADVRAEIDYTRRLCGEEGIPLPVNLRFPVFVSLPKFANFLAKDPQSSLMSFIAEWIGDGCSTSGVRRWLRKYPWLLILDGLDEVPASANRDAMLEAVSAFYDSADACGADLVVIATSRPQGYKEEFSSYYRMSLSEITRDQALRYSRRLTAIRHGEGSEKSEEIMERVEKAASTAETARLMTTPLQVTILVLLLSRSSRAPSQRYALFSNYYQVIYARELEKDTPSAQVLDRFKAFVDLLHWRIGLRLQHEAATASHTEASLPRKEVSLEIEAMLRSEGYEESECSEYAAEIMDSAADRLVFLVANTAERFGFELRSLQEFCAAQGLLEGGDEEVYQRLSSISCSDHWRNVFQLASGAIFSSNSARRDMIVSICAELNAGDIAEFAGSGGARLGSQLAIDILGDRITDTAPRHQRLLTETAVAIIGVPARNSWSVLRLVQFTDAASRKKLDVALSQASASPNIYERASALINMASQAEFGDEVVLEQFIQALNGENIDRKIRIFRVGLNANPGRLVMSWALIEQALSFSPAQAFPLLGRIPTSTWSLAEDVIGKEVSPAVRLILKLGRLQRDIRLHVRERKFIEVSVSVIRTQGDQSNDSVLSSAAVDAKLAGPMGRWEFLRRGVIFADAPDPETWELATDALMQAAEEDVAAYWARLPWPLAVWWENGRESLSVTAETILEWQAAQQNWSNNDAGGRVILVPPQLTPASGVPASFVGVGSRSAGIATLPDMKAVAEELADFPRNRFREARISWFWSTILHANDSVEIVVNLPMQVCEALTRSSSFIPSELIVALVATGDSESIARADHLARSAYGLTFSSRISVDVRAAVQAYDDWSPDRSQWGLARALIRCPHVNLKKSWQEVREFADDDAGMFEKLLTVWGGQWREEDEQEIAQYLYEHARGQQTAPVGVFGKFIGGGGGAKLAEILRDAQDPRYTSVVHLISRQHSSKVVSIPHPTFRTS